MGAGIPTIPVNAPIVPITVPRFSMGTISIIIAFHAGPPAVPLPPPPKEAPDNYRQKESTLG